MSHADNTIEWPNTPAFELDKSHVWRNLPYEERMNSIRAYTRLFYHLLKNN